jgi:hypothetical protein
MASMKGRRLRGRNTSRAVLRNGFCFQHDEDLSSQRNVIEKHENLIRKQLSLFQKAQRKDHHSIKFVSRRRIAPREWGLPLVRNIVAGFACGR